MNLKLDIAIFALIIILLLALQVSAVRVDESSIESRCNEHYKKGFEIISRLQAEEKLCDVTIIVGDKQFRVHKVVMSSGSPYFEAMFTNENMRESSEQPNGDAITLHDLNAEAFEMIKDYIYTGRITITDLNVVELLKGASMLLMEYIKADCCAYMKKEVDAENCIGIKYIADKYSCSELSNYASDFTLEAFEDVVKGEEFLRSTEGQVIDIISDDELATSEDKVYGAVMRWIRYQDSSNGDRTVHLPSLMMHVRFPQMEPKYLMEVSEDPLIEACKQCLEYVKEAEDYLSMRHLNVERADDKSSLGARFKQRRSNYLFAVGGCIDSTFKPMSSVERYEPRTNKWTEVASIDTPRRHVGVAAVNNVLYAVGGFSESYLSSIGCYNPHTNKWTVNMKPIKPARTTQNSVATLNGNLYVIGGYGDIKALQSVEKYDPNINDWIQCQSFKEKRSCYAVGVLDGYIYVLGGIANGERSNAVERYDLKRNEWHSVSSMVARRSHFGSTAHKGCLYAAGGIDEKNEILNVAERYDPREQKWEEIAPMIEPRYAHGLAAADRLLYAVGGLDSSRETLNTVEVYDPSTHIWSERASMLKERYYFGLAAMKF